MSNRWKVLFGAAAFGGLAWAVIASGQAPPNGSSLPGQKAVSVEDEIRELKRRADNADRRHQQQLEENKALREEVKQAREHAAAANQRMEGEIASKVKEMAGRLDRVIPRGLAVPYFGAEIPPGWELVTSTNVWKVAAWMPDKLRGQMPDLNGVTLIGTDKVDEVGKEVDVKKVKVTGDVEANGLAVALKGKDGWALNKGRGEKSWLTVPDSHLHIEVADPGGKIDDSWLHSFWEAEKTQTVGGTAKATLEGTLGRGSTPGVKVRWLVYIGIDKEP